MNLLDQNNPAGRARETRISGHPIDGWRVEKIESLPRALDGKLGWSVGLIRDEDRPFREARVQSFSTVGLFDAWDQALELAKSYERRPRA